MFFRSQEKTRKINRRNTFRPSFETLEDRRVMSGTGVTASLNASTHVLSITGTAQADKILVRQIGNTISVDGVRINGSGRIDKIEVHARGGNDTVRLDGYGVAGQAVQVPTLVFGGDGNDYLVGGNRVDELQGNDGNDTLFGMKGNDILFGQDGTDWIYGGSDDDRLYGGQKIDHLYGESGDDRIWGGTENDYLYGGSDDDILRGEEGRDTLWCGTGVDTVYANLKDDTLGDMVTGRWSFNLEAKNWDPWGKQWVDTNINLPKGTHVVTSEIVSYKTKNGSIPGQVYFDDRHVVNVYSVITGNGYSKGEIDISYVRDGITVKTT